MAKPPIPIQKHANSLLGIPGIAACLIAILIVAERGGLPSTLFQQLFMLIAFAVFIALAFSTKTLNAKQFFRPENGGRTFTRGFATSFFITGGLMWYLAPLSSFINSPSIFLLPIGWLIGIWIFNTFLDHKLSMSEAPDLVRMAAADHVSALLRISVHLLALTALCLSLGSVLAILLEFSSAQTLFASSHLSGAVICTSAFLTILGGRAAFVRAGALAGAVSVLCFGLISFKATQLVGQSTTEILVSMDEKIASMPRTDFDWLIVVFTMLNLALLSFTFCGITAGNMGGKQTFNKAGLNIIGLGANVCVLASLMTIGLLGSNLEFEKAFLAPRMPFSLDMSLSLKIASLAMCVAILTTILSACFFAISFTTLRGIAPIFSKRREPDGRLLFRARLYIILLCGVCVYFSGTFKTGDMWTILNVVSIGLLALITGPAALVTPPEGGWKSNQLLSQWIVSLLVFVVICFPAVSSNQPEESYMQLLSHPSFSAALPGAFLAGIILMLYYKIAKR